LISLVTQVPFQGMALQLQQQQQMQQEQQQREGPDAKS
jgi:hypothetical protein